MSLAGMTVIDISQQLPGPYASSLLAGLGATVIKVEPPGGDPSARLDPAMYAMVNVGKDIRRLDLKAAAGRAQLHDLVGGADVFIEGFRPRVVERLGASWETLADRNPRLVYCSITAAGQQGPYRGTAMHDLNLQGLAGLDPGAGIGVPWVDLGTATTAALAIASAWHGARASGRGARLDIAMLDTAVLWARVKETARDRVEPTYGTFATADGAVLALAILEDHLWTRLCDAFGWDDWRDDPSYATYADRVERALPIRDRVASVCRAHRAEELLALAVAHDLPLTPVGAPEGSAGAAQLRQRDLGPGSSRRTPLPAEPPEAAKP